MPTLAVLISLVVLAASGLVVAQIMGPDCNSTSNWVQPLLFVSLCDSYDGLTADTQSFNSLGQSPCIVAAYMLATCNDSVFVLQPLRPGNSYFVPVASDSPDFNECLCTVVAYNLLSVCDACQGENWRAWSNYSSNCVDIDPAPLSFPNLVPSGTSVPQWAVIDHTLEDNWNATKEINDEIPDVEPGFFPVNGTTSPDPSTIPFDDFSSRSNTGTIAGSVTGGVAALAAIGALFYFLRKRRRSQVPSAVPVVDGVMPLMSQEHPPQSGDETHAPKKPVAPMKLYYDPNDPRTYPEYQRMSASAQDVHVPVAPKDWNSIGTKVQVGLTPGYHGLPTV
ncbi:hypothetical protein H4582DRAFT_2071476 [Lactarius indigo]|nr:hypothetical protein H4582DRAFT_2071476 [Lactarius indigo]